MTIPINQFISVLALDNKMDFLTHMSGTDSIIVDNFNIQYLEDVLRNHKSQLSMVEKSVFGNDTIENNIDKILQEVNSINGKDILIRYLIIRYKMPDNISPFEYNGKVVGWQTYTK